MGARGAGGGKLGRGGAGDAGTKRKDGWNADRKMPADRGGAEKSTRGGGLRDREAAPSDKVARRGWYLLQQVWIAERDDNRTWMTLHDRAQELRDRLRRVGVGDVRSSGDVRTEDRHVGGVGGAEQTIKVRGRIVRDDLFGPKLGKRASQLGVERGTRGEIRATRDRDREDAGTGIRRAGNRHERQRILDERNGA